ncbi:MAG: hypothetical protein LHW56_01695 [Candidatus Cloacimonetes bacterium]|nr:hypothetical protein [Candidatus Cloacimonadota bacterium]MDY0171601.1 hypothetical protein [Candidatus Cloacimonadaceae bacterium]
MNGYAFLSLVNEDGSLQEQQGRKNAVMALGVDRFLYYMFTGSNHYSDHLTTSSGNYGEGYISICPFTELNTEDFRQADGFMGYTETLGRASNLSTSYYKRYAEKTWATGDVIGNFKSLTLAVNDYGYARPLMAVRPFNFSSVGRTWGHAPVDTSVRVPYLLYDSGYTGESEGKAVFGGTPSCTEADCNKFFAVLTQGGVTGQSAYKVLAAPMYPKQLSFYNYYRKELTAFPGFYVKPYQSRLRYRARDGVVWAYNYWSYSSKVTYVGALYAYDTKRGINNGLAQTHYRPEVTASARYDMNGVAIEEGGRSAWCTLTPVSQGDAYQPVVLHATINTASGNLLHERYSTQDILTSSGLTQTTPEYYDFSSPMICPLTGDLFIWTSDEKEHTGLYRRNTTTGQWARLPNTQDKRPCFALSTIDSRGYIYWVVAATGELIKYNTVTNLIEATYSTSSTPALAFPITDSSYMSTRGDLLCVDLQDNLWIAHNTDNAGVSCLSADGTTLINYNTSAAANSFFNRDAPGLPSNLKIVALACDPFGRMLALPANYASIGVFEAGQWFSWHYGGDSAILDITPFEYGILLTRTTHQTAYAYYFEHVPYPLVSYGWDGSQWVMGHSGSKPTHATEEDVVDGLTLRFEADKSYIEGEWFSTVAGTGIVKDNLQTLTVRYNWYAANLIYTENETMTAAEGLSLACAQDPAFLICERDELVSWSATLDGIPITLQTTTPSTSGQVYVSTGGSLTFHAEDLGKTFSISYYWLKE